MWRFDKQLQTTKLNRVVKSHQIALSKLLKWRRFKNNMYFLWHKCQNFYWNPIMRWFLEYIYIYFFKSAFFGVFFYLKKGNDKQYFKCKFFSDSAKNLGKIFISDFFPFLQLQKTYILFYIIAKIFIEI